MDMFVNRGIITVTERQAMKQKTRTEKAHC